MSYSIPFKCLDITLNFTNNPSISDYNVRIVKNNNNFRPYILMKNSFLSFDNLSQINWWQERKFIKISIDHLNTSTNGQVKEIIAQYNPDTYEEGSISFNIVMLKLKKPLISNETFEPISVNNNINKTSFSSQNGLINKIINNNIVVKVFCGRSNINELFDTNENNNPSHNFYNMMYIDNSNLLLGTRQNYINYFNFTPLIYPLSNVTTIIKSNINYENFLSINNLPIIINNNEINTNNLSLKTISGVKDLELTLIFDSADPLFRTFNPEFLTINGQESLIPATNPVVGIDPTNYVLNLDLFQIKVSDSQFNLTNLNLVKGSVIDISFSLIPKDLSATVFNSEVNGNDTYITNSFNITATLNNNIFNFTPSTFTFPNLSDTGVLIDDFDSISTLSSINTVNITDLQVISFTVNSNLERFKDLFINNLTVNLCSIDIVNKNSQSTLANKSFVNSLDSSTLIPPLKIKLIGSNILETEENDLKLITEQTLFPSASKIFTYKLSLFTETYNTGIKPDNSPWTTSLTSKYNSLNPIHTFTRINLLDKTSIFSTQNISSGSGFSLIAPMPDLSASGSWYSPNNDISFNGIWNGYYNGPPETLTFNSKETFDIYFNYSFITDFYASTYYDVVPSYFPIIFPEKLNPAQTIETQIRLYEYNPNINVNVFDFYKLNIKDSSITDKHSVLYKYYGDRIINSSFTDGLSVSLLADEYLNYNTSNNLINFDISNNPFSNWDTDVSFNVLSKDSIIFDTSDPTLKNKIIELKLVSSPYTVSFFEKIERSNSIPFFVKSSEDPGFPNSFLEIDFSKIDNNIKNLILCVKDADNNNVSNQEAPSFSSGQGYSKDVELNEYYFNQTYFMFNIIEQSNIDIGQAIISDITSNNNENEGVVSFIPSNYEGISTFNIKLNPNISYSNDLKVIIDQLTNSFIINSVALIKPNITNITVTNSKVINIYWEISGKSVYDFTNPLIGEYNIESFFNIYRQKSGSDNIELIGSSITTNYTDNTAIEFTNYNYYIEGVARWEGLTLTSQRSNKEEGFVFVCQNNPFPGGRWNNTRENRKLYRQLSTNCELVNQSSSTPRFSGNLFPNSLTLTKKGIYKFLSDGTRRPNR